MATWTLAVLTMQSAERPQPRCPRVWKVQPLRTGHSEMDGTDTEHVVWPQMTER